MLASNLERHEVEGLLVLQISRTFTLNSHILCLQK